MKKEGWGGGGTRTIKFSAAGVGDIAQLKPTNKMLTIAIGQGLPKESRPGVKKPEPIRGGRGGGGTPDILRDANRQPHSRAAPGRSMADKHAKLQRPPSHDAPALPHSPTRKAPSRPGTVQRMQSKEFLQTPDPGRAG